MEKRFGFRGIVKISGLIPQHQVRDKGCARGDVLAQLMEFFGQQTKPPKHHAKHKHHRKSRKYSPDTPRVELREAEATAIQALENDRRDQKSGNHEKDIDSDESAFHPGRECVKGHDRQHGNSSQAVDVRSISEVG